MILDHASINQLWGQIQSLHQNGQISDDTFIKFDYLFKDLFWTDRDNNMLRGLMDRLRKALWGRGVHRDETITKDAVDCIEYAQAMRGYERDDG